jgi:NAD(P)H-dependent FMN reductase
MSKKIQLIIGSTRQNRVAPKVAEWVKAQAAQHDALELEVVDLMEWQLPFMDAPIPPKFAPVDTPEAKAWVAKLAEVDAYIIVSAEYNRSIPAPLKNALDYTLQWEGKQVLTVSYGYIDGGASASKHLQDVYDWLKLEAVAPAVNLPLAANDDGSLKDVNELFAGKVDEMQNALAELAK